MDMTEIARQIELIEQYATLAAYAYGRGESIAGGRHQTTGRRVRESLLRSLAKEAKKLS